MRPRNLAIAFLITSILVASLCCRAAEPTREFASAGAGIVATVDRATGLIASIASVQPSRKLLGSGMTIYAELGDKAYVFDRLQRFTEDEAGYIAWLSSTDAAAPYRVRAEYRLLPDGTFREHVAFIALRDIAETSKLGLCHSFRPEAWERLIGGTRPVRVKDPATPTVFSFGVPENDRNLTVFDKYQSSIFPLVALEGSDRFVLACDLSLDSFVSLSPNMPANSFPSVQRNPLSVTKGQELSLTVCLRSFPKSTAMLRDLWRWYGENMTSSDEELQPYLRFDRDRPFRTLGPGNWCSFTYYLEKREKRMAPASHIWWSMWHDQIHETYPITGEWFVNIAKWSKMSATRQRHELTRIQEMGHKPYQYFRNLVNLNLVGKTLDKEWVNRGSDGDFERYGTGPGLKFRLSQEAALASGMKDVRWGFLNFANPEMRAWYLDSVDKCLAYYQPAGVALDFCWNPNSPKIQLLQGLIADHVRELEKPGKVTINGASGTPGQFLADAVLIENGLLHRNLWDYEVAKAFNTTAVTLERFNLHEQIVKSVVTGGKTWMPDSALTDVARMVAHIASERPALGKDIGRLKHVSHLRAGLRALALGTGWGYIEECPGNELVTGFAGEINGLPLITKSYAVRLANGRDQDNHLHAAAWSDGTTTRIAVFNDDTRNRGVTLTVDVELDATGKLDGTAYVVDAFRAKRAVELPVTYADGTVRLDYASLPPFTLLTFSYR